jgi:L-amino acid N-acyltransferase YncA
MSEIVRPVVSGDAEAIAEIYAPVVRTSAISFELDPPDRSEFEARIAEKFELYPWLVCEVDGVLGAYAYAGRFRQRAAYDWSVESSVYVAEDARRKGIGRRLCRALLETLEQQGYRGVYAGITLPNSASVGLHEELGFSPASVFERVGFKLGRWWHCWLGGEQDSPRPVTPFSALRGEIDWSLW